MCMQKMHAGDMVEVLGGVDLGGVNDGEIVEGRGEDEDDGDRS